MPNLNGPAATWRALLFDLDGTLIDHFRAIYRAYRYAAEQLGEPPVSYEKVRRTVGGSVPVTMRRLLGRDDVDEALVLFRDYFPRIMLEEVDPLPGAAWLVTALRDRGYRTAVFTNKDGPHARAVIDHLGWSHLFDAVIGTTDTPHRKPEEAFSRHVLDTLGISAAEAALIGDSPFDFQAARVVGMPAYGVATGSHTLPELQAENPDGAWPDLYALGADLFALDPPAARLEA